MISRKTFIGGFVAGIATSLFGQKSKFEDIYVDRYYILKSDNTVSTGYPGSDIGEYLIKSLKYEANFKDINEVIDGLATRKFRCEVTSYIFDKNRTEYNDIYFTKEWLTEFYNRHKDEDASIWDKTYAAKLNDFKGITS